jgi:mannose-6-phosphate isomerase-like protein (cupin superfamily)
VIDVDVRDGDFRGPYVHGRRGERFVYLSWQAAGAGMFRRAKLMLDQVPVDVLAQAEAGSLRADVLLAMPDGSPVCAAVRPPAITWSAVPADTPGRGPVRPVVVRAGDLPVEGWDDARGRLTWATLFSAGRTPTQALTAGWATVPPGGFLAVHRHTPAELYVLVAGRAILTLDDHDAEVEQGSAVFIPGDVRHGIRSIGPEPLRFIYAFAVDAFEDVQYHFEDLPGHD